MWLAKAMGVMFVESEGASGAERACMSIALKQLKTVIAARRAALPAADAYDGLELRVARAGCSRAKARELGSDELPESPFG